MDQTWNRYTGAMRERVVRLSRWRGLILDWGNEKVLLDKSEDKAWFLYICPFCWAEAGRAKALRTPMRVIEHAGDCLYLKAWDEHRKYEGG